MYAYLWVISSDNFKKKIIQNGLNYRKGYMTEVNDPYFDCCMKCLDSKYIDMDK